MATDLTPPQRELVTRAKAALNAKNFDYAIALLQGLLKQVPLYIEGHQLLRAAGIQKYKGLSGLAKTMLQAKVLAATTKASAGKKTPEESMVLAEELLALEPYNPKANQMLADAARQMGDLEIATLAYETVREGNPKNKPNLFSLAQVYMERGLPDKAEKVYEALLELDPRDGEALSGMKNASAANASKTGGWETAEEDEDKKEAWRNALRDEAESVSLEQESKVIRSNEAIMTQIGDLYAKSQEEPNNVNHPKRIAQLYSQLEDYENALAWYRFAFDLGGRTDAAIEKIIDDLELRRIEKRRKEIEPHIETDENLAQEYADLSQQRLQTQIDAARRRVERYPNDYQYHFEYGEALFLAGHYKEALPELQLGTKQPNVRHRAQLYIGQCYRHRSMRDLAIRTLSGAKGEIPMMNDVKKDITYELGHIFHDNGQKTEAVEQWKEIYEVDMAYRDVARLVEESYENGG